MSWAIRFPVEPPYHLTSPGGRKRHTNHSNSADADRIYIPYGIIDMVTLYQMGYPTMAFTAGKDMRAELLDSYRKRLILIPDLGEEVNGLRLWAKLGWRGQVVRPCWPEGTKDINAVYMKYGEQAVRDIIGE